MSSCLAWFASMAHKGQTGGSLGGRMVTRKQLKAEHKPELPPVDPDTLNSAARARRDAYRAEQEAREARARELAEQRQARLREDRARLAARGRSAMSASAATGRYWSDGR